MKKLILSSLLVSQSFAASFVIPAGTTETAQQTLSDPGDTGLVEEGATLDVANIAVQMINDDQSMVNNGLINTTLDNSHGIAVIPSNNSTVENNGTISTSGMNSDGVRVGISDDVKVYNNGTIYTTNNDSQGISNDTGARFYVENKGSILTEGDSADGIFNFNRPDSIIINQGSIITQGDGARGILSGSSAGTVIENRGYVETNGSFSTGIITSGAESGIINSGTVHTFGPSASALSTSGTNTFIVNSGTVISEGGFAMGLAGTGQQLTLKPGSNIQGRVISISDTLGLTVEKGLNLVLTLSSSGFGFNTLNIDNPYLLIDNTVVVVDRTSFALQSNVVADLSDAVLNGIYRHRYGFGSDCCHDACDPCAVEAWVEGIGSYRNSSSQRRFSKYDTWNSGFLTGLNFQKCGGYLGIFAGYLYGKASVKNDISQAKTNSVIGGVSYEKVDCDSFLGAAISIGAVNWKNDRKVMNNLAEGGVEHAKYDSNAFLFSPEISWTKNLGCLGYRPNLSLTARYAGLFFGSCSEVGSEYNLKVKDRQVNLVLGRAELGLPLSYEICDGCLSVEPFVGGSIRFQPGSHHIRGEILGESLSFGEGNKDSLSAFLYGFRSQLSSGEYSFYVTFEGSVDCASSLRYLGEIGISRSF